MREAKSLGNIVWVFFGSWKVMELRRFPGSHFESYAIVIRPGQWFWISGPISGSWDKEAESGYLAASCP